MARLVWTEPALLDLDEIAEYIALDSPEAATGYVQKVFEQVERLVLYPNSGKYPGELPLGPYREIVVPPCRIFYRVESDSVFVLHIMRSERLFRPGRLEREG